MENRLSGSETLPFVAMTAVQLSHMCLSTLSKAAFLSGLSQFVYMVYYELLGSIILLPWFLFRWISGKRLPVTFPLLCRFFCLSLIGKCLLPICTLTGLSYSNVTLAAAIANLFPIFTSLLAVTFRIEKLDLRMLTDQIKALGTFVAVIGALVVTLYRGPALLHSQGSSNSDPISLPDKSNWPLGCLILTLGVLLNAMWNIFQADTVKSYPDEVAIVFFCFLFGSIQTVVASLFLVEDRSEWRIHSKIEIIAILYAAFSLSLFHNIVITWCLHKKGPTYVSMFSPLSIAIASVMGFVFLRDAIYLGSVIGSAGIIVGFYAVIWAQSKAQNAMVESASEQVTPLLQNK